ncbi:MAG: zinc-ribbon domain-containing protein [Dehalococcoidia bacterium]
MFCEKCGAENPDDGTFCQKCGSSLTGSATTKKKTAKKTPAASENTVSSNASFSLPIPQILFFGSMAVLALGILYGILLAAGAPDWQSGTYKFAEFLHGLLYGIVGGGIMLGLYALVSRQ